jgi:hypothetical protein
MDGGANQPVAPRVKTCALERSCPCSCRKTDGIVQQLERQGFTQEWREPGSGRKGLQKAAFLAHESRNPSPRIVTGRAYEPSAENL